MSVLFDSKNLFDNKLKLIPLISSTIRSLLLKILENSDGFINFSYSCVPFGIILRIYSAPTIAIIYDIRFLLRVEKNKSAFLFVIFTQSFISFSGSGTCYTNSIQVSKSYFFMD